MVNFLGAAFGFGARDVGLDAAMGSATKNLDKINDLMDVQDKKGSGLGKMWRSIGERVKQFNIASIAGDMRTLTGETGNLSNSLESMAVSYTQAAKPIIASMNLTEKQAQSMTSRVTGMAIGLNTSADAVAETFKAIHDAGGPASQVIDAMGISERDWVKIVQTTGVTMQDYVGIMGDMVASWGAAPEQAGEMIDNILAIGKAAKIGTEAIKGAKQQLDALDVIFEQLPPTMARSADEIQSLMESTYKLAGAFREMGETEEQATQLGRDTGKMFAEQAVLLEKLYEVGGEGALDDSPLFTFLTMLGVGTQEARDIIDEGSRDVVAGVTRINDIFMKMGGDASPQVQFALGELTKVMGQSAAGLGWLASNTDTGTKALAAMNSMAVKGKNALRDYGRQAFSTGRSLQEQFDLARESFDTQIRSISRKDVRGLAKEQMGAYRTVADEIKGLGSDETWGPLVRSFSVFKQMGLKGVMLDVAKGIGGKDAVKGASEMGVKFDLIVDSAKQLGEELGPAMEILGKFGPLGVAAGGLAAWFALSDEQKEQIKKTIRPLIDWIGKNIKEQFEKMADPETINGIIEKAGNLLKGVIDTAIEWGKIGKKVFAAIDWNGIANNFVAALSEAFKGTVFATVTGLEAAGSRAAAAEAMKRTQEVNENIRKSSEAEVERLRASIKKREEDIAKYKERLSGMEVSTFFEGTMGEEQFAKEEEWLLRQIASEKEAIQETGSLISELIGQGLKEGGPAMGEDMSETLETSVVPQLPQSPPLEGPLAGDFLTNSGYDMLMLIGEGIEMAAPNFQALLSQVLEDSVMLSLEAYSDKVEEWSQKKSLLRSVAQQMAQDFGGTLDLGTINMEGGADISAKETFEAALELPGLAGVIAAIASDGHKTRLLLKKIWEETHTIAESDLVKKTMVGTGGTLSVLPS